MMPFGFHQAAEYFLGAALVSTSLHLMGSSQWLVLSGAALVILLAAFSDGPLGAWRVLGHHAHRAVDGLLVALLALSPLAPGRDVVSIIVLEAGALMMWRLVQMTDYDRTAPVGPAGHPDGRPAESVRTRPAPPAAPAPASWSADPAVELAVRRRARMAGLAVGIFQRRLRDRRDRSATGGSG